MKESIECCECNLVVVVSEFLKRVEDVLRKECINVRLEEVAKELNRITPVLSEILSKWIPQIIYCLYLRKTMSFNELKRTLNISSRVLSDKLKVLENYKIVTRVVEPKRPPRVYYKLTDVGENFALSLIPLLIMIQANSKSDLLSALEGSSECGG